MTQTAARVDTLRVKGGTDVRQMSGLIGKAFTDGADVVSLRAVGAGAVNQAVKSIAIARHFLGQEGRDVIVRPRFDNDRPSRAAPNGDTEITVVVLDVHAPKGAT